MAEFHHPGKYWHRLGDGRIQCDLCPRDCKLNEGQRGACFVRMREGDQIVLTTYGRSSGFCIDPIEKKPLNQFYPGSSVLSFGTAGCNLACKFCQNWDISKSKDMDTLMDQASPETIAIAAEQNDCKSVAFTYNDPVIFAEYAMDTADACHARGIKTVAVTAGYMHDQARRDFYGKMDAANVDLKAFTEDFYFKLTGSQLQPVLDTLVYLRHGLHYVYTGTVHHTEGDTTFCPNCHAALIVRDWYHIHEYRLTADGRCPDCNSPIAGRFDVQHGHFGRQRIPIAIHQVHA